MMGSLKKFLPLAFKENVLYLVTRIHRMAEILQYSFVQPKQNQLFYIVSCERNAGAAALKCLDSVYRQCYDRKLICHVYIDDASSDNTPELIENWLSRPPDHHVRYSRNTPRHGGCANTLTGFRLAPPDSILAELNGDDWLPDNRAIAFLNKVYQEPKVWMTYNSCRYADGKWRSMSRPYPRETVQNNTFRDDRWYAGHLQTFRAALLPHVKEESLIDPETTQYWANADDMAFYWSLLELSGRHAKHLYRTLYVYNVTDYSEIHADPGGQQARALRIRKMPRYTPLSTLEPRTTRESS